VRLGEAKQEEGEDSGENYFEVFFAKHALVLMLDTFANSPPPHVLVP
jgi:hypothetical protein